MQFTNMCCIIHLHTSFTSLKINSPKRITFLSDQTWKIKTFFLSQAANKLWNEMLELIDFAMSCNVTIVTCDVDFEILNFLNQQYKNQSPMNQN